MQKFLKIAFLSQPFEHIKAKNSKTPDFSINRETGQPADISAARLDIIIKLGHSILPLQP